MEIWEPGLLYLYCMVVSGQSQTLATLHPVPISQEEGCAQSNSGRFDEQKYLLLLPGFEARTLQLPVHCVFIYFCICDVLSDAVCSSLWALNVE